MNLSVPCHLQDSMLPVPVLVQTNPVHALPHLFETHFNIYIPPIYAWIFPHGLFPFIFIPLPKNYLQKTENVHFHYRIYNPCLNIFHLMIVENGCFFVKASYAHLTHNNTISCLFLHAGVLL